MQKNLDIKNKFPTFALRNQKEKAMKKFKLHGNTAYWNKLTLSALNLNTLENDATSPIPEEKRVWVNVVDNLYKVEDTAIREILKGEISDADKDAILTTIRTGNPDFILSLEGKVVGYANYHYRNGYVAPADAEETPAKKIDASRLVDSVSLALIFTPSRTTAEDIAAFAEMKEEKNDGENIERIVIIDHGNHRLYVEDIDMNVIEEDYDGNEEDYIRDTYTLSDDWTWDYIVAAQYICLDSCPIDIPFDEL